MRLVKLPRTNGTGYIYVNPNYVSYLFEEIRSGGTVFTRVVTTDVDCSSERGLCVDLPLDEVAKLLQGDDTK